MTRIDSLVTAAKHYELMRRVRQLETAVPLHSASITRGDGLRVAIAAGIRLEGLGSITAGGLTLSSADGGSVGAGNAFVRGSGGGQVGAGGTLIGGDGRISNASGVNRFNGNVAADGGVSGASASFAGALGAASAYITGSLNSGGHYSRGDIATEGKIYESGRDLGRATDEARFVANDAWERSGNAASAASAAQSTANEAKATADGRVTQAQLQAVSNYIASVAQSLANLQQEVTALRNRFNQHTTHPPGSAAG